MQREIPILSEGLVTSRICIGRKVAEAASLLEGDVYLVCDASVRTLADSLIRRVHRRARYDRKEGAPAPARIRSVLSLQTGESEKNLYTVMDICRWLLDNGADRKALLLAVGGSLCLSVVAARSERHGHSGHSHQKYFFHTTKCF